LQPKPLGFRCIELTFTAALIPVVRGFYSRERDRSLFIIMLLNLIIIIIMIIYLTHILLKAEFNLILLVKLGTSSLLRQVPEMISLFGLKMLNFERFDFKFEYDCSISLNFLVPLGLKSIESIRFESYEGFLANNIELWLSSLGETKWRDRCETRWSTGWRSGLPTLGDNKTDWWADD
jgi:hypothetical protein